MSEKLAPRCQRKSSSPGAATAAAATVGTKRPAADAAMLEHLKPVKREFQSATSIIHCSGSGASFPAGLSSISSNSCIQSLRAAFNLDSVSLSTQPTPQFSQQRLRQLASYHNSPFHVSAQDLLGHYTRPTLQTPAARLAPLHNDIIRLALMAEVVVQRERDAASQAMAANNFLANRLSLAFASSAASNRSGVGNALLISLPLSNQSSNEERASDNGEGERGKDNNKASSAAR